MFIGIRNKLILGLSSLMLFSAGESYADSLADKAIAFCRSSGGDYSAGSRFNEGNKTCMMVKCSVATSGYENQSVTELGSGDGEDRGGAGGTQKVCITISDDDFIERARGGGSASGSASGGSGSGGGTVDVTVSANGGGGKGGSGSGSYGGSYVNVDGVNWPQACLEKKWFSKGYKISDDCLNGGDVIIEGVDGGKGSISVSGRGSGSSSGAGTVYVRGGSRGSGGGSVYVRGSGGGSGGGTCNYTYSIDECLGAEGRIVVDGGIDCINCGRSSRSGAYGVLSGIAEIAGAIAPPLAYYGVNARWANAYQSSQQAWAGAAAVGFEQCRLMQTNYVRSTYRYMQSNELPHSTVMPPECNGYGLGQFAGGFGMMGNGMGGFGSPWGAAGYSPGFMGGMYGPYGMYNPYGGMNGGFGMGMGMPGMGGGLGIGIYGGIGGGMGMGMPGMGGMYGGMGMPGMYGNPWGMGATGMGMVPWGNGAGSYWNGSGGWGNSGWGGQGGYSNWGNIQQSYAMNQQALGQDAYLQQAALGSQYMGAAQNMYGYGYNQGGYQNYGYAPYSPMNMGFGMSAGFGFGF